MKFIPYDETVAQKTVEEYKKNKDTYKGNRTTGHVAEALVRHYFGLPMQENKEDVGYDLIIDGYTVDVKNIQDNPVHHKYDTWVVDDYKPLTAQFYLFTYCDPNTKQIALVGYLPVDEVKRCRHVVSGQPLYKGNKYRAHCPAYTVDSYKMWLLNGKSDVGVEMATLATMRPCYREERTGKIVVREPSGARYL